MQTMLTRSDYEEFLIRLYFGSGSDYLQPCISRAYRDFNRTLQGIRDLDGRSALYTEAESLLQSEVTSLRDAAERIDQDAFDEWHRQTCSALASTYERRGFRLHLGQAQKWVNMTLKYVFAMGESRLPGYSALYPFCHVPLDNIVLRALKPYGYKGLPCAWSRLDDYRCYVDCQQWIRGRFEQPPLDVEFRLWMQ